MRDKVFKIGVGVIASIFIVIFCILIIPPFMQDPNIIEAFGAGFVNPYTSGYSIDVVCCWAILLVWIVYESPKIKYGWVCVLLGIIPGVAVGFACYLLLRKHQLKDENI